MPVRFSNVMQGTGEMCCRAMLRRTNEELNLIIRFMCQVHYLY
jgi:hypothetical protein